MKIPVFPLALCLVASLLGGCGDAPAPAQDTSDVPPPLPAGETAWDVAGTTEIKDAASQDWSDLHNVFALSESIVSGSEPYGDAALKRIRETWGVKTILSVDGKAPDVETAKKYGMRYVHVPIQYSGISAPERMRIAKVFREMEGPFYVHCFHGKHRGPAAAALGRVVLDGASREQAVAEMRQWCGTSGKYEGLYETVGRADIPSSNDSASYDWNFPAAHELGGFRHAMIEAARVSDHLKALVKRDWKPDPTHPDLHAGNEAAQLVEIFQVSVDLEEVQGKPDDFRAWLHESLEHAKALDAALKGEPTQPDVAAKAYEQVAARCDTCHRSYRNEKK